MHFKKAAALITTAALSFILATQANASAYTVVKNDSLYSISNTFGTSTSAIMKSNSLTGYTIYPGQILNVPAGDYTVKSGDTLYLIAKRVGISLAVLRKANNKWDDMIYAGQKLILPGASGVSATTAAGSSKTLVSYSSYEFDLLARLITSEAANQPYEAKVAVGAVVLNRVRDSRFPNTIKDVIYQKDSNYYQFTPVQNGLINKPASADSKKAAQEALNGIDPTKGALYYFDDSATNKWLWSKPIALRVDRMVYVY